MNRREFVGVAAAGLLGAQTSEWGVPVLDMHFHPRPAVELNVAHLDGAGVTKALMLTRIDAEGQAKAAMGAHPGRFMRFISADVTKADAIARMRASIKGGALGMGEVKYHVAVDGPEMRAVYELAAELKVPVTIHFQEVEQFKGEGVFNTPLKKLPEMLKAYPKTTFFGHADCFWANVSADVSGDVPYPTGKIKPGGLTDRMLSEFPNLYGDMSANSGRNALGRDPDFMAKFVERHQNKLFFGSDCSCEDGRGKGQRSQQPLIKGKCVARETLTALKGMTTAEVFRKIVWGNGSRLLGL